MLTKVDAAEATQVISPNDAQQNKQGANERCNEKNSSSKYRMWKPHLDEGVELLITANGELQVARGNTLHLKIFGRIACKLQHLNT